ncbi:acyltransferase [Caulifigura coniformis]|nr:hypothetical protein [Caulifigura coniformis]
MGSGSGNQVTFGDGCIGRPAISFTGQGNAVTIGRGVTLSDLHVIVTGDGNRITIGDGCDAGQGSYFVCEGSNCALTIGEGSTFVAVQLAVTEDGSSLVIGKDCMFAYDIEVRTGDSHGIRCAETGRRLNAARDVTIGDHVWVAAHALVLKGVSIAAGCVVATGAVVTKSVEEGGVVVGGNPAQVLRRGIVWTRSRD